MSLAPVQCSHQYNSLNAMLGTYRIPQQYVAHLRHDVSRSYLELPRCVARDTD